ncbi:MAG: head GIN domain-containing protein [Bacteroidota bacterium]
MKKAAFLFMILSVTLGSCMIDGWNHGVSGNGTVVEETRSVSGFTGVHVSTGIDVYLSEGDDFEVIVEADENLMEVILTELKGDMLVVKTDRVNIRRARSKKVHVTLPELSELRISSAGDCEGQTPFTCKDLKLGISSAGDLSLEVEAERISLDISSSGDARIAGNTNILDVTLSSAGDLNAFDLVANKVDVNVSSAGDARVHATEEISMNVSSAGNIYYMGDARVLHSHSSSAGDIIRK